MHCVHIKGDILSLSATSRLVTAANMSAKFRNRSVGATENMEWYGPEEDMQVRQMTGRLNDILLMHKFVNKRRERVEMYTLISHREQTLSED